MEKSYKVFIGGLPVRIEKEAICEFFSQFGTVLNCKLKKNQQTGRSLGFAYLTVKEQECYDRLLEETIVFHGRIIEIKPLWKKNELGDQLENEKKKKIFVSNLPHSLTNSELTSYFSRFGQLTNAYIIKDPDTGGFKDYGYVIYKRQTDSDAVVRASEEGILVLGGLQLKAEPSTNSTVIAITKQASSLKSKSIYSPQDKNSSPNISLALGSQRPLGIQPFSAGKKRESGFSTASFVVNDQDSKFKLFGASKRISWEESSISSFVNKRETGQRGSLMSNTGQAIFLESGLKVLPEVKSERFIMKPRSSEDKSSREGEVKKIMKGTTKRSILQASKALNEDEDNYRLKKCKHILNHSLF